MNLRSSHKLGLLQIAFMLIVWAGCGSALSANAPPYITGTPATGVLAGQEYVFRPSAGDPENQKLTFSIVNKPSWMTLGSNGSLTGRPADDKTYNGIVLSVSDGSATTALPTFSITVGSVSGPTVTSIAIAPAKATVAPKATLQYAATASMSDGTTSNVTATAARTSSSTGIASINSGGLATALTAGSTTIAAAVGKVTGSTTLTVSGGAATIKSIVVTPARTTVAQRTTLQFTATATWSDGSTSNVSSISTWGTSIPSVATVTSGGLATAVAPGASNISAKIGAVTGATILTVTKATTATITSIAVSPAGSSATQGSTVQFRAIGTYSDGTTRNVTTTCTWASSSTGVATINTGGLATAVSAGTTTISAAVGSIRGSTGLTVQTASSSAHTDVLTYKNDLSRSGLNSSETVLTTANVNSTNFGLKFRLAADGLMFGQPLYASQVPMSGSAHNTVYFVTEHNSAYAYDSDTGALLWHVTLQPSGETTSDDRSCDQISPEIGATATPVIDRAAGTSGVMYVVAMSKDSSGGYHQRLHALNLATGAELFGGPTEIQATYPTAGGGTTQFDPGAYKDRGALLLLNGEIYTTWASHCDDDPYTGWMIAYSGSTLARTRVFNIAPNSGGFGPAIWMGGGAPAVDSANNIYLLAANGVFETTMDANGFPNRQDYGNSFLKISTANHTLAVVDYFTMWNVISETAADLDLGGGGALLLPDLTDSAGAVKHLVLGAGKDGNVYVVDRDSMGRFNSSKNNIWQELDGAVVRGMRSTPAYFNSHVYLSDRDSPLKAFTFSGALLGSSPTSQTAATFVYPGTVPIVSSNGTANGIVWAAEAANPGVLHAYNANNLAAELYNSKQAANSRDSYGAGNKYPPPTVADGKVFVVGKTEVGVFGLLH